MSPYRWVALFIVWAAFLLSYVDRVAWSTVAAPVGASLGIEVSLLGAFVTAFYAGYVVANIIGGMLTDFLGGRAMMTFALLPLGVLTFFFGETTSLTMGILIQLAMGLAAGADYSAGMKVIPAWFTRDRGRAMGIYTTATSPMQSCPLFPRGMAGPARFACSALPRSPGESSPFCFSRIVRVANELRLATVRKRCLVSCAIAI
jgi:MFS family permease